MYAKNVVKYYFICKLCELPNYGNTNNDKEVETNIKNE